MMREPIKRAVAVREPIKRAVAERAPYFGLALVVAILVLAAGIDSCGVRAEGQDRPVDAQLAAGGAPVRDHGSASEVLTRAVIGEADGHLADYLPILDVLRARARRVGSTPARIAVRYCALYRARHPTPRQAEILALPGFPTPLRGARAAMWANAWGLVVRWQNGELSSECDATPTHFGDRHGDAARALRMRWLVVDCGDTANGFWRERSRDTFLRPSPE